MQLRSTYALWYLFCGRLFDSKRRLQFPSEMGGALNDVQYKR